MSDKLRSLNTKFWEDPWIETLNPKEKLLFLYLLTNTKTNMLGIYEISSKKISFETGLTEDEIINGFEGFERVGKAYYKNNYVILINFLKNQKMNTNMKTSAVNEFEKLPDWLKSNFSGNGSKGFESLTKGFEMVRKIEIEIEEETKTKIEKKGVNFPDRFKEKQTDPEYSKDQTELAISICSYLNVSHPESGAGSTEGFRYIRQFVVNIENAGKIDYFKDQFKFYKKAWDATSLKPHNYKKYIGTFPDYSDGVWCSKDWKKEVKGQEKAPEHTTMEDYHKMFGS